MKLFLLSLSAQYVQNGRTNLVAYSSSTLAINRDEAIGIGFRKCQEVLPDSGGYFGHQCSPTEVAEVMIRAAFHALPGCKDDTEDKAHAQQASAPQPASKTDRQEYGAIPYGKGEASLRDVFAESVGWINTPQPAPAATYPVPEVDDAPLFATDALLDAPPGVDPDWKAAALALIKADNDLMVADAQIQALQEDKALLDWLDTSPECIGWRVETNLIACSYALGDTRALSSFREAVKYQIRCSKPQQNEAQKEKGSPK